MHQALSDFCWVLLSRIVFISYCTRLKFYSLMASDHYQGQLQYRSTALPPRYASFGLAAPTLQTILHRFQKWSYMEGV